jgi:hypothetical protein
MTMKTAAELDCSTEMRAYFERVEQFLVTRFEIRRDAAKALINLDFAREVDPLERALVMHRPAEQVAEELARMSRDQAV